LEVESNTVVTCVALPYNADGAVVNTPVAYRVLVVASGDQHVARELVALGRQNLVVDVATTSAEAAQKMTDGQFAAVVAVHSSSSLDALEVLARAAQASPDSLRVFLAAGLADVPEGPGADEVFRLVGPAADARNLAGFITEGVKLHRFGREQKELFKKVTAEYDRLRKREKLLDMVVRERTKELETAYLKLKAANRQALLGLAEAIEAKDPYTKGHCGRVAAYAMALARECHYPEQEMEALEFAAFLHDIGKIGVRDAVLLKPGPLDEEEWKHMKIHPEVGFEIASKIDMLKPTMAAIRNHHERWDGNGYPDKLAAEQIPLNARIVCLSDAFDAMATDRPYKRALTLEESFAVLRKCSGSQFDPQLVELFLERKIGELFIY
jgi:putative nucleotidyltransferase with HDIG domain